MKCNPLLLMGKRVLYICVVGKALRGTNGSYFSKLFSHVTSVGMSLLSEICF